jgi:CHASE2 domain-containing sensor protein
LWPSLHWAVSKAFCRTIPDASVCAGVRAAQSSSAELHVSTYDAHYEFPIVELRDLLQEGVTDATNPLSGRIALLGGYYSQCDRYPTPFGMKPGVEIIGSAIETELATTPRIDIEGLETVGIELILAIVVAWIHHTFRPRYALLLTILVLSIVLIQASYEAFRFTAYRVGVIPFLVGIWIEQSFESAENAQRRSS